MRGPEESGKSTQQDGQILEAEASTENPTARDPCSSPPCKRLKQAVLNFGSVPQIPATSIPTPSTSVPPSSTSVTLKECLTNGVLKNEVTMAKCGGLVTAAPSPPKKEISTTVISECNNDDEMMIVEPTSTNNQDGSPKSPSSPNQDNNTGNILSSAEKKKKREEQEKKREAKKKEKEEKLKQREQAKAAKEKEKLEAKQKKEQERLDKQAEKEKKEKEKLEKKLKEEKEKKEKKEKREEEKRKKEEEQNAKLEGKRKKEEEKRQQEEEMKKKNLKTVNNFKSFFTKTASAAPKTLPKSVLKFEPFEIKPNMSLAPLQRTEIGKDSKEKFDNDFKIQSESNLYFQHLQKRKPLPPYVRNRRRKTATKSVHEHTGKNASNKAASPVIEVMDDEEDEDDDDNSESSSVIEIQDDEKKTVNMKAVFLKFCENNRPPYYGTQRKRSRIISARNPFKKDEAILNYEVDSDDEWEEEEPGESLSDSEPEDNNEEDNEVGDEEEEDGWMVPHGYLSDDEGIHEEDEEQNGNDSEKKEQQLAKAKAWETELKKRCKAMKPVCIGCVWPTGNDINEVLKRFEACLLVDGPSISINAHTTAADDMQTGEGLNTPDTGCKSAKNVPYEAMPDLIKLIHGSCDGVEKLVNSFKQHWSSKCSHATAHPTLIGRGHISKRQINKKIRAIAKKESRLYDRTRWYVLPSILASYGLESLKTEAEIQEPNVRSISISPPNAGIKQFARPVTEITKPVALPVNMIKGINQPSMSSHFVQSDEIQIIETLSTKPNCSVPPRRVALQTVRPVTSINNSQATSTSLQTSVEHKEKRRITLQTATMLPLQMTTVKPAGFHTLPNSAVPVVQRMVVPHLHLPCSSTSQTSTAASASISPAILSKDAVTNNHSAVNISMATGNQPVASRRVSLTTVSDANQTKPGNGTDTTSQIKNAKASSAAHESNESLSVQVKRRVALQTIKPDNKQNQMKPKEASSTNPASTSLSGQQKAESMQPMTPQHNQVNCNTHNKDAELETVAVKRQGPSPECTSRASKVLKMELVTSINNNNNSTASNDHQCSTDGVEMVELQQRSSVDESSSLGNKMNEGPQPMET